MYRNFYSYSDMPKIIRPGTEAAPLKQAPPVHTSKKNEVIENGKLLGKFELDDVILIVVTLLLFEDNCDDNLLLIVIAFIFLSGR